MILTTDAGRLRLGASVGASRRARDDHEAALDRHVDVERVRPPRGRYVASVAEDRLRVGTSATETFGRRDAAQLEGAGSVGWDPVASCAEWADTQRMAHNLTSAQGASGGRDAEFWL